MLVKVKPLSNLPRQIFFSIVRIGFIDDIDDGFVRIRRIRTQDCPIRTIRDADELAPELGVAGFEVGAGLSVDAVRHGPLTII